ncbi:hypothetical protein SNE40_018917 [Patella caerulea]|uniref:BZIP domain-containing protein n=1 Tax=Patella caerulea TaxID=87958 RepID=A0AAN8PDM1_PATCE
MAAVFYVMENAVIVSDQNLIRAIQQTIEQGSILPILKEEIKTKIQVRRYSRGLTELKIEPESHRTSQLSKDEVEQIESRKQNNRKASKKHRLRQKDYVDYLEKRFLNLASENCVLQEQKKELQVLISKQEADKSYDIKDSSCSFYSNRKY